MKLIYTRRAGRDLIRLCDFIGTENPQAAKQASQQLRKQIRDIKRQLKLGLQHQELEGVRELIAWDYIVRYYLSEEEIVILNIWHGKENR